jgi:hypothetical protein
LRLEAQLAAMIPETGSGAHLVTVTTRPSALSCLIYADKSIKIDPESNSAEGLTGDSRSNHQHYRFSCIASIYAG